jgi:iron complex outermembrane receptor protein
MPIDFMRPHGQTRRARRLSASASPVALACLAAASLATTAGAQTEAGPAAAPAQAAPQTGASAAGTVQEIVVTAQKRSENLQNVPISIEAITAADAVEKGITGTQALSNVVPGLVLINPANTASPYLRGVGSNLFDPSAENSVAIYVDGVYYAAPQVGIFDFNNIASVEVLKGPQGTLFGRNATGGVIQVTTKNPSSTPSADFSVGYGNYNDVAVSAYATSGITKNLAADIAFTYENQGKGYGRDLTTNAEIFKEAIGNFALRSKILFTPTSTTTILLAGDYSHSVSDPSYQQIPGLPSPLNGETYPGRFNTLDDQTDRNRVNTGGVSLEVDQDVAGLRLTSITAYRQEATDYGLDDDDTSLPITDLQLNTFQHNYSEEFRVANRNPGWLTWVAGAYFYGNDAGYAPADIILPGVGLFPLNEVKQTVWSWAGFAQATAKLPFDTDLTLGERYTNESQDFLQNYPSNYKQSQEFDKATYRIALDHHFTHDISAFISYDTGFKTGGFNQLIGVPAPSPADPNPTANVYKPEILDATEAGLKTELFDHHLRFNLDGFLYQYRNIQVDTPTAGSNLIENAAAAHIKGIEGDFEWLPVGHLTLSGGFSVQEGHYTELAPSVGTAGAKTAVTPPVTATLSADYLFTTAWGTLRPSVTVAYNDGFYWQPNNLISSPSYTIANGSLTFAPTGKPYQFRLWVKNLTDTTYYIARIQAGAFGFSQEEAPPRTFGVTATAHF